MKKKKVFISYSWDSEMHRNWIRKVADALEEIEELHIMWDGYDLDAMSDKNKFMESGIYESDYVVVVSTANYKLKADARNGGVGIETYLASAAHWDGLQKSEKTKIILVLREPDSVPNYLKGHLYVDFSLDAGYQDALKTLLSYFREKSTISRPLKLRSLSSDERSYTFTKVEDLIRVNHTNRRVIVNSKDGTDFSDSKKIKYELWETRSPTVGYFLALADNIHITQTIGHAIEQLKANRIRPSEITILRPRAGRPEQALIATLFTSAGFGTQVYEYTYKDYIWEFCIDESQKGMDPPTEVANYTDQGLTNTSDGEISTDNLSARDFLVELLQKSTSTIAHLVVAPGGMGKTSLCLAVAARLHNRKDLHSSVILIQAAAIKNYVAEQGLISVRIDSLFRFYSA